ncbi:MAG TPA: M48 family metallopeptidase [Burkholderiaceae bacterium]|nr:M48 family metallopeptidase [Burkholderiaceae bacterium]
MRLENRAPAEGINSSRENPLKELTWLLAGSLSVIVVLVFAVSLAAQWLAPRIPYQYEAKLAATLPPFATAPDSDAGRRVQAELQLLADRLARHMEMPDGMVVRVGYRDDATVNAFATIGGQAVFFRGLLSKLGSEDALAMVMAHELAHLKYRHASAALGRGVAAGVILSVVSAELGRNAAAGVLSQAGMATVLTFNRDQEREADQAALRALHAEYGHIGGAIDLFEIFARLSSGKREASTLSIEFLRTHPLTANRVAAIKQWAVENGTAIDGPRRPLPPGIAALTHR